MSRHGAEWHVIHQVKCHDLNDNTARQPCVPQREGSLVIVLARGRPCVPHRLCKHQNRALVSYEMLNKLSINVYRIFYIVLKISKCILPF